ncbi:hypothetical protein CHLNCDRAFT_28725 [Chlorella variabilis]|uniref:Uncharacterized protein n=1 Tax=Chlorella variabilis TaxID=554065 RepID=E1ZTN6_CHLVA|nr:hypothetical protein CHLNCDRAFT_28725 [Chlorella variabilis]EFN50790.1 hypothetical protein CHLNCDRAFT_28725 [Chlorella variabilis]|eukprot:XP_005842892.1 hypothetical protein CHLNCDRAFT_28725 [Chlorella variabilis]
MSPVCRWRQWEARRCMPEDPEDALQQEDEPCVPLAPARRCMPEDPEGTLQQEDEPCVPLAPVGGQKMHA